ncbi:antiviral helicase, partial [Aureobasidium melanogenum]
QVASDVTVPANKNNDELPPGVRPPVAGEKGKMEVVPVLLSTVDAIGHLRIFLPTDLRSPEQRNNVRKGLEEVKRRFPDGIAILDPVENMGITDEGFKKLLRKIEILESRLLSNPLHNSPRLAALHTQYEHKVQLGNKIKEVRKQISDAM